MAGIRSRDTKPELLLRRTLHAKGVRGWRLHRRDLAGQPDLAFGPPRVAVFVDGAFWHGHPEYFTPGRSGDYWDAKIARNRQRDREVDAKLRASGWTVLRFWDFDVLNDPAGCARIVAETVKRFRQTRTDGSDG